MAVELPFISDSPIYQVSTTLDGTIYVFDVRWNARDEAWYFDLSTEGGEVIVGGIRIILGMPLGSKSANPLFPDGVFLASDTSGGGQEAGIDDLGDRVIVRFFTNDEIS